MRAMISVRIGASVAFFGHAAGEDLNRSADPGERILHLVRDDGRHLPELGQRRLLADLLLHPHALAQVVEDAGELALAADRDLADRQVQRKRRAVLAQTRDLAPYPDDLGRARSPGTATDTCRAPRDTASGISMLTFRPMTSSSV